MPIILVYNSFYGIFFCYFCHFFTLWLILCSCQIQSNLALVNFLVSGKKFTNTRLFTIQQVIYAENEIFGNIKSKILLPTSSLSVHPSVVRPSVVHCASVRRLAPIPAGKSLIKVVPYVLRIDPWDPGCSRTQNVSAQQVLSSVY